MRDIEEYEKRQLELYEEAENRYRQFEDDIITLPYEDSCKLYGKDRVDSYIDEKENKGKNYEKSITNFKR